VRGRVPVHGYSLGAQGDRVPARKAARYLQSGLGCKEALRNQQNGGVTMATFHAFFAFVYSALHNGIPLAAFIVLRHSIINIHFISYMQ